MFDPKLVTPMVLFMCGEDAPTGMTFHAGLGKFSRSATFVNEGLTFDRPDVTYEDLLEQKDKLLDLSAGEERSGLIIAQQRQQQ